VAAAAGSGYVRTARAIGASDREVLWRHAMPNALLGATALIGAQFAFLVTGLVIIETIFAWPGIGWLLAVVALASVREKLRYANPPAALRGLGKKEAAAGLFGDLVIDASRVEKTFSWTPSVPTLEGMARSLVHPPKPDPTR
jgi:hypothetical protein